MQSIGQNELFLWFSKNDTTVDQYFWSMIFKYNLENWPKG